MPDPTERQRKAANAKRTVEGSGTSKTDAQRQAKQVHSLIASTAPQ